MNDKPSSLELISVRRDQAFEAIVDAATLAESYSRSIAEAAFRGDRLTVEVHLRQLRSCCIDVIQVFNEFLRDDLQG